MRANETEAEFRAFVAAFSPTLLRTGVLLLRDRSAAEDAVQTTLERTFRRWRTARHAPEAYSRRVLVNVCRNDWRHRRRHPTVPADAAGEPAQDDGAARAGEQAERRATLAPALAALPQLHREVLVMRFFLDLSVSETAAALRVPEGTVKSATHRALARLRAELGDPTTEVHHAG